MPKLPGIPHRRAVAALEKAGFILIRQGKHSIMSNGVRTVQVPRNNPVNAYTMAKIARDAGLSIDEFKRLLGEGAGCFIRPEAERERDHGR